MMDKNFTPIIIDFGFSKEYRDEKGNIIPKIGSGGSKKYAAPELYEGKELKNEKADIFSLGVILFNFVTKTYGFNCSRYRDPLYLLIRLKKYELYWEMLKKSKQLDNLSGNFKDLYLKMVAYDPKERPSFGKILDHPFLKDVKDLTQEEENQIKNELENLFNNHIKNQVPIYLSNESVINNEHLTTRAGESKQDEIFEDKSMQPKKIPKNRLLLNQAIAINGNISVVDFMNSLYRDIKYKYADHSYIEASKNSLKMEVVFEYEENEEEEEKKEEVEEEDTKEEIEHFEDFKMEIELFEYEKGKYLLEFIRTGGKYSDYYPHFLEIKNIITKKNISKK